MLEAAWSTESCRFGPFEVDIRAGALLRDGRRVPLSTSPQRGALSLLIERAGAFVTREELSRRLWRDGTVVDFEHGLNTVIRKLRRALGDCAVEPRFIETVAGRGYRFTASITRIAPDAVTVGCTLAVAADGGSGEAILRLLRRNASCSCSARVDADDSEKLIALCPGVNEATHCALTLRGLRSAGVPSAPRLRIGIDRGGGTVNRARARLLCDRATAGEILVSATLAEAVGENAACQMRDREPIPDIDGSMLFVESAEPSGVLREALLARTSFVGRTRELDILGQRLEAVRAGPSHLAFVAGAASRESARRALWRSSLDAHGAKALWSWPAAARRETGAPHMAQSLTRSQPICAPPRWRRCARVSSRQ